MRSIHTFDAQVARAVVALPVGLKPVFLVVTLLGSPTVTMAIGFGVVVAAYFRHSLRMELAGGGVWLTVGINSLIKLAVERERPLSDYALAMPLRTHSFPSGHAAGSMVAYGLLAYLAWRLLPQPWSAIVVVALGLLIFLIGVSRVYLGAHFPTDVIAGWLLGGVALVLIIVVVKPLQ